MASDDFKRIFETLRVAVVVTDAKGAVQYANSAFGHLAGHEGRVLAGASLIELFAADDRKRVSQNLARVGDGKAGSAFFDAMLLPPEGTPHWVSVALQPALDARDKASGVVAILQDIGTQRETDEALNLVSARLLALAEAAPVAMMIETAPGEVELANDAFCRLLGIESAAQSLSGLPVKDVLDRAPEAARSLERREIAVEGEPAGAVWTARGPSGPAKGAPRSRSSRRSPRSSRSRSRAWRRSRSARSRWSSSRT
jgi:PAS domain S-box-containing protein